MAKKKKQLALDLTARFAMAQDAVERLASSSLHYSETEDGWYSARKEDGEPDYRNNVTLHDDGIAVIHIDGPLGYRAIPQGWWGLMGDYYDGIQAAFDDCMENDNVLGIVLDINSPGGVVNGCSDLAEKIFKARGKKIYGIVARTGGQMQSGAYWLASACEKIYAGDSGIVGSIGTLAQFSRGVDKEVVTIVSNYSPDKYPNPESKAGADVIRAELDALAKVFIDTVARNRGYTSEYVMQNFGKGGNFVGQAAVDAGLIDAVMSFEDMCAEMKRITGFSNINNEVSMQNKNASTAAQAAAAEQTAAPTLTEAEIKAQGVQEYKARAVAVKGIFAGLPIEESKLQEMIDGEKSVSDLTTEALAMAKEQLKVSADAVAKANASAEEKKTDINSGLTPEQVAAVKDGLEAQASAQNKIIGGASTPEVNGEKELQKLCKAAADKYYNKRG